MQTTQTCKVAVVMGSESDLDRVQGAFQILSELGIPFEKRILSAHRTSDDTIAFAETAAQRGLKVLIAAAGKAAHLGGVLASRTLLPVIGIPLSTSLSGLDALFSTVQMPTGYPVASVAIDGAANAALLAAQILALQDPQLAEKLAQRRLAMAEQARSADKRINESFS